MFGHFLTWMQETTSPVLVMATANNIKELPPEFLRAGRFDAMFFVDVPSTQERTQIIRIMNHRYSSQTPKSMADDLSGWSGAEIEQLARDSLFDGLEEARENIVPLSKTMKEEIIGLQQWAQTRASSAPHFRQNLACSGFSVSHLGQRISSSRSWQHLGVHGPHA